MHNWPIQKLIQKKSAHNSFWEVTSQKVWEPLPHVQREKKNQHFPAWIWPLQMLKNTMNRFYWSPQKGISDVGSLSVARQHCFLGYYCAQWCHTSEKLEIPSWYIGIATSLCSTGPAWNNPGRNTAVSNMFVYMVSFHIQQLTFQWYLETCVS